MLSLPPLCNPFSRHPPTRSHARQVYLFTASYGFGGLLGCLAVALKWLAPREPVLPPAQLPGLQSFQNAHLPLLLVLSSGLRGRWVLAGWPPTAGLWWWAPTWRGGTCGSCTRRLIPPGVGSATTRTRLRSSRCFRQASASTSRRSPTFATGSASSSASSRTARFDLRSARAHPIIIPPHAPVRLSLLTSFVTFCSLS